MTPQQIVGMVVRLFAVWLVVVAFQIFVMLGALHPENGNVPMSLYVTVLVPLLFAALLWSFPMFIAHKLVPRTHDANVLRIPARELTAAASAIIGIGVVIATLPHLAAAFIARYLTSDSYLVDAWLTPERKLQLLGLLIQCGIGVLLVVKPWFVASRVFPDVATHEDELVESDET